MSVDIIKGQFAIPISESTKSNKKGKKPEANYIPKNTQQTETETLDFFDYNLFEIELNEIKSMLESKLKNLDKLANSSQVANIALQIYSIKNEIDKLYSKTVYLINLIEETVEQFTNDIDAIKNNLKSMPITVFQSLSQLENQIEEMYEFIRNNQMNMRVEIANHKTDIEQQTNKIAAEFRDQIKILIERLDLIENAQIEIHEQILSQCHNNNSFMHSVSYFIVFIASLLGAFIAANYF